jgi:hypothetical protein
MSTFVTPAHRRALASAAALSAALLLAALPAAAQKDSGSTGTTDSSEGIDAAIFDCPTGSDIANGVSIVINLRPGEYRVTALGVGGFDPIMGVLPIDGGTSACVDDSDVAAEYTLDLPATGEVAKSSLNSQVIIENVANDFASFEIVVGGYQDSPGEVVLLIEDLAVTSNDGDGDPLSFLLSQNVIDSGIDVTAYHIAVVNALDPYLMLVNNDYDETLVVDGEETVCDDAGNEARCFGFSADLRDSFITTAERTTPGGQYDASMSLDVSGVTSGATLNYLFTSFNRDTTGDYIIALHFGIGEVGSVQGGA